MGDTERKGSFGLAYEVEGVGSILGVVDGKQDEAGPAIDGHIKKRLRVCPSAARSFGRCLTPTWMKPRS